MSSSSSRVTFGSHLGSQSVIAITRSTHDAKSKPSLVFQFCKTFIRDDPRHCARCIIFSSCLTCKPKTRSGLRLGKRYDKNATASRPRHGIIWLCLLNQATTVFASRSPVLDGLVRF